MKYIYAIAHKTLDFEDGKVISVHRGNVSLEYAQNWIKEWLDDGGKDCFVIIRKPESEWEIVE